MLAGLQPDASGGGARSLPACFCDFCGTGVFQCGVFPCFPRIAFKCLCVCVCVRESSGRHYIQSGRQLLIAQQLPREVTDLARRIERVGLESLLARDLRARLR